MSRKGKRRREAQRARRERAEKTEAATPPAAPPGRPAPKQPARPAVSMTVAQRKAPRARKRSRGGLLGLGIAPWVAILPVLIGGVGAIVAVVVLSGGSSSGTSGTPTPFPEDDRVKGLPVGQTLALEASGDADNAFYNPATLTGKAGEVIEITVRNTGTVIHNVRVSGPNKAFDVDTSGNKGDDFEMPPNTIEPGKTGTLKIKIDQPGTYPFRCDFHPLVQKGTLVLQ